MEALSVHNNEAKKLINKDILCANNPTGLGNYGVLLEIDRDDGLFKIRMTGGTPGDNWHNSIRYFKYITKE